MKQEHRFVAQLFGYLAPFVDDAKPLYLSLDGEAAKKGVRESHFKDPTVPDIWLTLVDKRELRIEAKILSGNDRFIVGKEQLSAWFATGKGAHPPTGWVVANEKLTDFYYWAHSEIAHQPTKAIQGGRYYEVRAPTMKRTFGTVREVALHILGAAT